MSCIESPDCGQASHKAAEAGKLAFTRTESAPSWGALSQGRSGFLDCSAPRAPCAPDAAPPRVLCEGASRRAPLTAKPVLHFLAAAASCARRNVSQQIGGHLHERRGFRVLARPSGELGGLVEE